jgi:monoamine oxidase
MMKLKRRELLSLFALSLSAVTSSESLSQNSTDKTADVIVIGAGIAGLAAARELQSKNLRVLILEARDRLGGRIWTNRKLNMPLDLGASWIHGVQNNPIMQLAQQFGIQTLVTDYDAIAVYNSDGKRLSESELTRVNATFSKIMQGIEKLRDTEDLQASLSNASLKQGIDRIIAKLNPSPQQLIELNYALNAQIEQDYAADAENLSLLNWDSEKSLRSNDVLFPQGYDRITQKLSQGLKIQLNQVVKEVNYTGNKVQILTNNGTFTSDRVVITLPLGVLKSGKVKFSPPLPTEKQNAIKNLGMGVLNKVYFQFPQVFWQEQDLLGYISEFRPIYQEADSSGF